VTTGSISPVCFGKFSDQDAYGTVLPRHEEAPKIKIIVSFEDTYHAYRGALSAAIRILRPDVEVKTVEPEELREMVVSFDPDFVIGYGFDEEHMRGVPGWVGLSLDPAKPTRVSVRGKRTEIINPTLDKLLLIIEEVEEHTRA
jgi:DNA-binding transcriptional LysR family regulator